MSEIAQAIPIRPTLETYEIDYESGQGGHVEHVHGYAEVEGARKPIPYSVAIPENLCADTLAVIVPGFGAIKRTSRGWRESMAADQGIATISYDPARIDSSIRDAYVNFTNPQKLHYDTIGAIRNHVRNNIAFRKIQNGSVALDAPATLLPHSMGGMPAAEYAVDNHRDVNHVIYIGSIGLEDPLGLKIISRAKDELLFDVLPGILMGRYGYSPNMAKRSLSYFARNPIRTVGEIVSCARADIRPQIAHLSELGVKQSVVCLDNDRFFYPIDTLASVGQLVDSAATLPGCEHTAPQTKARLIAQTVGAILKDKLVTV